MTVAKVQDGRVVDCIRTPTRPVFYEGRWYDCQDELIRAEYLTAAGFVPVTITAQPEDTATETTELGYEVGDDAVTQVWIPRPWTAEELAAKASSTNRSTITGKARAALAMNEEFLDLTAPTNAQALAQIRLVTRECSALIRLMLNELSTTSGT